MKEALSFLFGAAQLFVSGIVVGVVSGFIAGAILVVTFWVL